MRFPRHIGVWVLTGLTGVAMIGCADDQRPSDVPASAMYKAEGDQRLAYTAPEAGTVWVTAGKNNVMYSAPLNAGDRVVLDPQAGKIMVDGQIVLDKDINQSDHKIFFLPGNPPPTPEAIAASDRMMARPQGVPASALVGGEGKDMVSYTAPHDGYIWITNDDQDRILASSAVSGGDVIVINPQKNLIAINGQPLARQDVTGGNHRVFFSDDPSTWRLAGVATPAVLATDRPADVPTDAMNRTQTTGRIDFIPTNDGTVWIVDTTTNRTVYTGRILASDHLVLDPSVGSLTLNGQSMRTTPELAADHYAVYFTSR